MFHDPTRSMFSAHLISQQTRVALSDLGLLSRAWYSVEHQPDPTAIISASFDPTLSMLAFDLAVTDVAWDVLSGCAALWTPVAA